MIIQMQEFNNDTLGITDSYADFLITATFNLKSKAQLGRVAAYLNIEEC